MSNTTPDPRIAPPANGGNGMTHPEPSVRSEGGFFNRFSESLHDARADTLDAERRAMEDLGERLGGKVGKNLTAGSAVKGAYRGSKAVVTGTVNGVATGASAIINGTKHHVLDRPKAVIGKAGKYALGAGLVAAGVAYAANTFGGKPKTAANAALEAREEAARNMGIVTAEDMLPAKNTMMGMEPAPGDHAARVRGQGAENRALNPAMTAGNFEDAGAAARRINKTAPQQGLAAS